MASSSMVACASWYAGERSPSPMTDDQATEPGCGWHCLSDQDALDCHARMVQARWPTCHGCTILFIHAASACTHQRTNGTRPNASFQTSAVVAAV